MMDRPQWINSWLWQGWFFGVVMALMGGCAASDQQKPQQEGNQAVLLSETSADKVVRKAVAKVRAVKNYEIQGSVVFTQVDGGVQIMADVEGLSPGAHGFHVHEFGDCSGHGAAAGGHFNPTKSKHGGPDSLERHVGDLGNLIADDKGQAHYERIDKLISLEGPHSIVGRSIVIHANPDDFVTQPTGASGDRIACGVIELQENSSL